MTLGDSITWGLIVVTGAVIIKNQNKIIMANERIEAALSQINESTNVMADATLNIADDIRRIKEKIGTGMTDAEVEAVTTRLEASAQTLTQQAAALQAIAAETPEDETPTE
jgi:hypothetical protein